MTLPELLSNIQASQRVGRAEKFTSLTGQAAGEKRDIKKAVRNIREAKSKAAEQSKRQERRRGLGRLGGAALGYGLAMAFTGGAAAPLLAGAATGLGSFAGQKAAGDLSLGKAEADLKKGLFFSQSREDVTTAEADLNRFLSEAEKGFKQRQLFSAVGDAFTGGQLSKVDFSKLLGRDFSGLLPDANVPSLERANIGSLTRTRIVDPTTGLGGGTPFISTMSGARNLGSDQVSDILFGRASRLGSPLS